MKTLKVFVKAEHGRIVCMCLRSNRRCGCSQCEKDVVTYDEYRNMQECFRNRRPAGTRPNKVT